MLYHRARILICLLLLLHETAAAQRFPFYNFTIENGLVQSQATSMTQDKSGNLWVGTLGGLSRFDGKKFTSYSVVDGLLSNTIYSLAFSRSGQLLISSAGGLQLFDGKTFSTITTSTRNKRLNPVLLTVNRPEEAWFIMDGKVYSIHQPEQAIRLLPDSIFINDIHPQGDLLYVAANGNRLYILDNKSLSVTDSAMATDPQLMIIHVLRDRQHNTWLLCNKGLYLRSGQRILPYMAGGRQLIRVPLLSGTEDANGYLWLGTFSGALRVKDSVVSYFNQQNGLSNNIVYKTFTDKEGNIWLSTDGQGIFRYSGGPFISVDESFGLPDKQVTGIAGDHKGNLFFGTYSGKLSSYRLGGTIKNIPTPELQHAMISGMVMQDNGKLWIGTKGQGLFCYENGRLQRIPELSLNNSGFSISALHLDQQQRLWAGLQRDMCCIEGGKTTFISLKGATVNAFLQLGNDSLLLASTAGFLLYHQDTCIPWGKGSILDSISVQCMAGNRDVLYLGSAENGLLRYETASGKATFINKRNGLRSDFIYNILLDTTGDVWAGTGHGICRLRFYSSGKFSSSCYDKANGVLGLESNSNAAYRSPDNYLWFGTTEGVSCYIPSAHNTIASPVSIVLESVKLFGGKDIDPRYYKSAEGWYRTPDGLSLPYRYNNLSFSFQAITLSPTGQILYRYKLSGADSSWSLWSPENTINFSALAPGNYTLIVECSANGIKQAQVSLRYGFVIRTPFHKSVWFFASILGAAILLGVYLQYTANKRKLHRQKREDILRKEEQSRVRERTAEDFHDEVGNKLTRINILTNVLKSKLGDTNSDTERIINQIQDNTQQLYSGTRDILWSLQPANDNLYEITNHIRDLATELFSDTDISFTLSGNTTELRDYKMPLDKSRNYIMIWKEALNNCLKYAQPTKVMMQLMLADDGVQIRLEDDGRGFDQSAAEGKGNGMKNMRSRAARLGGSLTIISAKDKGTQVLLLLPPFK